MLGNGRIEAMCFDGERRLAHIRGKLRKKVWINQGDMYASNLSFPSLFHALYFLSAQNFN